MKGIELSLLDPSTIKVNLMKKCHPQWRTYEDTGNCRLIEKNTCDHDAILLRYAINNAEDRNRLITNGCNNIAHDNRFKTLQDTHAAQDTKNVYEIRISLNNTIKNYQLQSSHFPFSCAQCRK